MSDARMRIGAGACIAAAAVSICASPAAHGADGGLAVLNAAALTVQAKSGEDRATGVLTVLNTTGAEATSTVNLQAQTDAKVKCNGSRKVPAGMATRVTVTCTGLQNLSKAVKASW